MRNSHVHLNRIQLASLALSFLLLSISNLYSQNQAISKADRLYKDNHFAKAIPLYVEGLAEKKNISAMTKLANCYRTINQMEAAEEMFSEVVQSDRAKPITYFYYGETLMSNGKYDAAKVWLAAYLKIKPTDETAQLRLKACDLVKDIEPYFKGIDIHPFAHNSEADDSSPVYFDGSLLFCSDRKQGTKLLKQKTGTTDRDFLKIYNSSILAEMDYASPISFSSKINELNKNTANPTFWIDTLTGKTEVYFIRNSFESGKNGEYNLQLYRSSSDNGKNWRKAEIVNFCSRDLNYFHPSISSTGDTLFFVLPKKSGYGGTDIYYSNRRADDSWSKPVNMGPTINTVSNEGFPYMHKDGKLYFCSKGHVGYGGFDIFMTEMDSTTHTWKTPVNLGRPINTPTDDISICFMPNGKGGAFTSSREGGDDDIFLFQLTDSGVHQEVMLMLEKEDAQHIERMKKATDNIMSTEATTKKEEPIKLSSVAQTENILDVFVGVPPPTVNYESAIVSNDNAIHQRILLEEEALKENKQEIERVETIQAMPLSSFEDFQIKVLHKQLHLDEVFYFNEDVYATDEYSFEAPFRAVLDELVGLLQQQPNLQIELGFHSATDGAAAKNAIVSRYHAIAASAYIRSEGISGNQITAVGYGASQPLSDGGADGLENRRLEIRIVGL